MIRIITILTAGLFIVANTLHAQSRTCRIVFPERPQSAPKVAYLFDGKVSLAVTLPSMNLSEVIKLPPGELTIAITTDKIIITDLHKDYFGGVNLSKNLPEGIQISQPYIHYFIPVTEYTEGVFEIPVELPISLQSKVTLIPSKVKVSFQVELNLDGTGKFNVNTGIGFLDHMLSALGLSLQREKERERERERERREISPFDCLPLRLFIQLFVYLLLLLLLP